MLATQRHDNERAALVYQHKSNAADRLREESPDLIFDDRVKAEPVHLPTALSFSEELAPRRALRRRLAG